MKATAWKKEIEKQIKFDAEYIPSFATTIKILSEMLEERDRIYEEYINTGARPVIEFTSDRGAVNLKPNPLLKLWQELNNTALQYCNALGITPTGLRKLGGQLPKDEPKELDKLERLRLGLLDEDETENPEPDTRPKIEPWRAQYAEAMKRRGRADPDEREAE